MYNFPTVYWGEDQSTEVVFEAITEMPAAHLVSACMVFARHDGDKVVLSRPARGWGIIGGHREPHETAHECIAREALEEAAVTLRDVKLVGRWNAKKRFASTFNQNYPEQAYQLLFVADVDKVLPFTPQLEILERAFVPINELSTWHHDAQNFTEILKYLRDNHI